MTKLNPTPDSVTLLLNGNEVKTFKIDSLIDESNLNDSHAYNCMGKRHHLFNRQVSFESISDKPVLGLSIVTNGKDLRSFLGIKSYLGLDKNKRRSVFRVFNLWKEVFHASSRLRANDNPYCLLNYWGHGVCSEIAHATAILLRHQGISWRRINLVGHWVFEFYFDRKWTIVDPNQLVYYLHFDNQSLASYKEVLEDPLLILRTKAFGKYGKYDIRRSWRNFGLYNFLEPKTGLNTFVDLDMVEAFEIQYWDLYPGEKLTFFHERQPEAKIGDFQHSCWTYDTDYVAGEIELVINSALRRSHLSDTILVNCGYPVYKVVNHRTGAVTTISREKLVTTVELKIEPEDKFFSIFCHGNRNTFPSVAKGRNQLKLTSNTREGKIKINFQYNRFRSVELPQITANNSNIRFEYQIPHFKLKYNSLKCEKVWWQIAPDLNFEFIIPNFDCLQSFEETIKLSAIDDTFINNCTPYFFRIKGFSRGVWGEWSKPVQFSVKKLNRPRNIDCRPTKNDKLMLRWEALPETGVRYLVFGSDRYDFIPDIYSNIQVERSVEQTVTEVSENKNLLLVTEQNICTVDSDQCFFRIVAVKNESYSIPSVLVNAQKTINLSKMAKCKPIIFQIAHFPREEEDKNTISYPGSVVPFTPKKGEPNLEIANENHRNFKNILQSLKRFIAEV